MFGLEPLNRPVAISEILLLLAFAAFIGWLLGRLVLAGRISSLRSSIRDKEAELEECRRTKAAGPSLKSRPSAQHPTYNAPQPEQTPPVATTYITADPLLPALTLDDTPQQLKGPLTPVAETPLIPDNSSAPLTELPTTRLPAAGTTGLPVSGLPATGTPAVGNSEAAVLNRIAARASELNFDRIGRALATEADDLKDIVGIGPFLERKLHSLGIYTFRQVANFTKEDINKVNEIIEFFPGRIERDNWVDQSKGFYERRYGAKQ